MKKAAYLLALTIMSIAFTNDAAAKKKIPLQNIATCDEAASVNCTIIRVDLLPRTSRIQKYDIRMDGGTLTVSQDIAYTYTYTSENRVSEGRSSRTDSYVVARTKNRKQYDIKNVKGVCFYKPDVKDSKPYQCSEVLRDSANTVARK